MAPGPLDRIDAPGIKIEGPALQDLRAEVANLLDRGRNHNFPGAQPVSFARRHLEELCKKDYYVCEKSDGMRYLLYLTTGFHGEEVHYLIDRKNDYWFVPPQALHFPIPKSVEEFHRNTVIDGELVMDKEHGGYQPKYLVFDCMVLDGNSLMNRTLDKRLAYFQERIMDPYKNLLREYPQERPFQHFVMEMKAMQLGYGIELMFNTILPALPHGNDGLIFTCRTSEYKFGTDQNILKWKPENENSIDFRLGLEFPLVTPDKHDIAEGITKQYYDYDALPVCNLFVYAGDDREDPWYATMHLEPDEWDSLKAREEPLQDRIVECYMDSQKRWRFMRFRDDKTNANHTSTVQSVIESITDRVTQADLLHAQNQIRDEWKRRAAEEVSRVKKEAEKKKAASQNTAPGPGGVKRKADEPGPGRPSPGPPGHTSIEREG